MRVRSRVLLATLLALGLCGGTRLGAQAAGVNPYGIAQDLYLRLLGEWLAPARDPGEAPDLGSFESIPLLAEGADLRFSIGRDETGWVSLVFFDGTAYRVLSLSLFDQSCLRMDLDWAEDSVPLGEKAPVLLLLFLDERHALLGDGSELDSGFFVEPELPVIRLQGPGLP